VVTPVPKHSRRRPDSYQIDQGFASTLRKRTIEREQDPNSSLFRQDKYQSQDPLDQIIDGKLKTPQQKIKLLQAQILSNSTESVSREEPPQAKSPHILDAKLLF